MLWHVLSSYIGKLMLSEIVISTIDYIQCLFQVEYTHLHLVHHFIMSCKCGSFKI